MDTHELHDLLIRARQIQEGGHLKSKLWDNHGRVCILGAFGKAERAMILFTIFERGTIFDPKHRDEIAAALGFEDCTQMVEWNNQPERCLEDVLERFDEAIEATAPELVMA